MNETTPIPLLEVRLSAIANPGEVVSLHQEVQNWYFAKQAKLQEKPDDGDNASKLSALIITYNKYCQQLADKAKIYIPDEETLQAVTNDLDLKQKVTFQAWWNTIIGNT
jgi:hypothetical protein